VAPRRHGRRPLIPPAQLYVLGNASIDVTLAVPRLPRDGETLMATGLLRAPGGKGLNQAVVASRAGARVRFCAPLGPEPDPTVPDTLRREHFLELRLIAATQPTDLSTLIVAANGENVIISTGDCADGLTPYIARSFTRAIRPQDWLLIQGNLTEAATWEAVSRAANIVFNTAPIRWTSDRILRASTIVIANQDEAATLTGADTPQNAAASLATQARHAIVTLGAAGCLHAHAGTMTHHPAPAVAARDTTGAGDTFCGTLAAGLSNGIDLDICIAFAQRAAALTTTRPGCFGALPTAAELRAL
jgi:ribokinase